MMVRIDVLYNAIVDRPLLNELSAVILPRYILIKFKTNKGLAFDMGD